MRQQHCNSLTLASSVFAVAAVMLFSIPRARGDQAETQYGQALQKLQDAIASEVQQKQLPAFSIALVDGDQTVWAAGFGFQDAAQQVPATADTVYRVGSVSKLFTDIAVMQLVEAGQLDLDAPVQNYLPELKPANRWGVPITLRQMMSHQSGMVREPPVGNYFDPTEPTLQQTIASLNQTALVYRPETKTKYSNAAIAVVGAVLEKMTSAAHPQIINSKILDPLGMNDSSFVINTAANDKMATGWMWTYDGRRFEAPTFLLGTGPAGNLYSSVRDLSKFLSWMLADAKTAGGVQILKPETYQLMTTPIRNTEGQSQGFGIGFHVHDLDGYVKIGHGGAVYGFSTQLEALPERNLGVVAAASLDGSNGVVGRLTDYALRLMIAAQDDKPLPDYRQAGPVPGERASQLVGRYREAAGERTAEITRSGESLFMQHGTFRYELRAATDDAAVLTDDVNGFGTEVDLADAETLLIGGTAFKRLADEPPSDVPQRWKGLIGEYGWEHNTLYILEIEGQLHALIEWFYYYPLTEISENEFAFPDYGLYHGEGLRFKRDADGIATAVVAAEVNFVRREVGTRDGETFKITPVRPVEQLRSAAGEASPPKESGAYRQAELVEPAKLDPTIKLDIRYATTNNFMGAKFYQQPRTFLQRPAAEAVVRVHRRLKTRGWDYSSMTPIVLGM